MDSQEIDKNTVLFKLVQLHILHLLESYYEKWTKLPLRELSLNAFLAVF